MALDDPLPQAHLSHAWDEFLLNQGFPAGDVEPKLMDAIRHLHALDNTLRPDPAFVELTRKQFAANPSPANRQESVERAIDKRFRSLESQGSTPLSRFRSWPIAILAAAAVLMCVTGYWQFNHSSGPESTPVVQAPVTWSSEGATPRPSCNLTPRSYAELARLNPAPTNVASPNGPAPVVVLWPTGTPVTEISAIAGIDETMEQFYSCSQADDVMRLLALVSDRYIEYALADTGTTIDVFIANLKSGLNNTDTEEGAISSLYQLSDGRLVAPVPMIGATYLVFFERNGDRWTIDYIQDERGAGMKSLLVLTGASA